MPDEERHGVRLTNLDQPLFPDSRSTKRDLVDYLERMADRILPVLRDRPLSVVRVLRGQEPFMQKNLPRYAPDWLPTISLWAQTSHREVRYARCEDVRTLLWFANQRAVEYHPTLCDSAGPGYLVMDLDPPEGAGFAAAVGAAYLVREVLTAAGLSGAVKSSGAKGLHIFVPLAPGPAFDDVAAATRAVAARAERLDPALATTAFIRADRGGKVFLDPTRAGAATVVAAYSPRIRPGTPVSVPVAWSDLDGFEPGDHTIHTVPDHLGDGDPWAAALPAPQALPDDLVAEGHTIPAPRVQAMHEGKRRARARRAAEA